MDHLAKLAEDARNRVERGYYETGPTILRTHRSLSKAIQESRSNAIITEVKFSSPSHGKIRDTEPASAISQSMVKGGACALSVLTEPDNFNGGLKTLSEVAEKTDVPLVMKDIIVSPGQLEAGSRAGADAVVIVSEVFERGLGLVGLEKILSEARRHGLEVLAEANGIVDFLKLRKCNPDLYGINNRNLSTFQLELSTTEKILRDAGNLDRPIVSESGISSAFDVRRLRKAGANAFLVGTSIMKSSNIEAKVRELVQA